MKEPDATVKRQIRWKTAVNILGPALLTLLAIFIALEVGLRYFYQLIPIEVCAADGIIGTYICQPYFEYDKPVRLGYRYVPGFELEGIWNPANPFLANPDNSTRPTERDDSFAYHFVTDEYGFPNEPATWQDQYDIVIAGDSFTIRTAPVTWIERLEEFTGQEILTFGAPSWGTLNEAEAIRLFGLDKKPAYVLLMFFEGNDLLNTAQYLQRQDSGLDWREYDLQNVPLARRLLTPHLVTFLWQKLNPPEAEAIPDYRYPVVAATEVGDIETVFKDVHLLPLSADYETLVASDEFAAVSTTLIALNEEVTAIGATLVVVYIPSKEHVLWSRLWEPIDVNHVLERTVTVTLSGETNGTLRWEPTYLTYGRFNETVRAQERLLTDFTEEQGIAFLNLTPIFWQASIEQGELYHFADAHWNQAGNDLAAAAIWDFLQLLGE